MKLRVQGTPEERRAYGKALRETVALEDHAEWFPGRGSPAWLMLLALVIAGPAIAQDTIDTNRPGYSASAFVLKPGVWQIETGVAFGREEDGQASRTVTLPYPTLRFGVGDDVEVLLEWEGMSRRSAGGRTVTGAEDPSIGTKIQVSDDDATNVFAFLFDLSMPLGDDEFTSDSWDPAVGLAWLHRGSIAWAGTARLTRSGGEYVLDNAVRFTVSAAANGSIFVEWEANIPEGSDTAHWLNSGYVWLLSRVVQFDINGSIGLGGGGGDYSLGAGWSYRF